MTDRISLGCEAGQPNTSAELLLRFANRHGLIAGATGTGKTVTLQVLAEGFSRAGVPVFMADVKGDLGGLCQPSGQEPFLLDRARTIGQLEFVPQAFPVAFWDVFGEQGHPVRTTITDIGPLLLARMLELNETQEAVLSVAFRYADDQGLLLLDLPDLRALLTAMTENAAELSSQYGQVSKQSIATIQRNLLRFEDQGANHFLGEPALDLRDFMRQNGEGKGYINILSANRLMRSPRLYAGFLLWMLAELFEDLPEAGDLTVPKLVFFFDEAHLLFNDAPKALVETIEQVVRLIRSKGVGVYFITQNPQDIPEAILGQLGNRVQHALRAFTPAQQQFIKVAAQTYRPNPAFEVETVLPELSIGEALVSTLDAAGAPSIVQRVLIAPPTSRLGPCTEAARELAQQSDGIGQRYDETVDRESAYELLQQKAESSPVSPVSEPLTRCYEEPQRDQALASTARRSGGGSDSMAEMVVKTVVRAVSSSIGRQIAREVMRGLLGSRRR
jgi:uncharacterized protein